MKVFQRLIVLAAAFLCVLIVSDTQEAVSELLLSVSVLCFPHLVLTRFSSCPAQNFSAVASDLEDGKILNEQRNNIKTKKDLFKSIVENVKAGKLPGLEELNARISGVAGIQDKLKQHVEKLQGGNFKALTDALKAKIKTQREDL